jgi:hypothetical protein
MSNETKISTKEKAVEAKAPVTDVSTDEDDYEIVISETINAQRLKQSGGEAWLVQLPGSPDGIVYEFILSKIIHFVSQLTKNTVKRIKEKKINETEEEKKQYFSYAVVMTSVGKVLKLPINSGIFDTYYQEFCTEDGTIDADLNPSDLMIRFKVSTILNKQTGKEEFVKGTKYLAKNVGDVEYLPVYSDAVEVE